MASAVRDNTAASSAAAADRAALYDQIAGLDVAVQTAQAAGLRGQQLAGQAAQAAQAAQQAGEVGQQLAGKLQVALDAATDDLGARLEANAKVASANKAATETNAAAIELVQAGAVDYTPVTIDETIFHEGFELLEEGADM